jgi:hypothetical protein
MSYRLMWNVLATHLRTGDGSAVVCCMSVPCLT